MGRRCFRFGSVERSTDDANGRSVAGTGHALPPSSSSGANKTRC